MHSDASDGKEEQRAIQLTMPATVPECHAVIEALVLEVGQLRDQMAWLQERLKVDSRNSSKPPSSDGPGSGNRAQRRTVRVHGVGQTTAVVRMVRPLRRCRFGL